MKMMIVVLAFFLISPALAMEFKFNQSDTVEIPLQFDCDEIEILRYEDVPAEETLISESSSEELNNSKDNQAISKTDLKNFYKQNDFNVIGKTRKDCPASFKIKIPDEAGFYYLPIKIYAGSEETIQYIGIEVVEIEKEPEPAPISYECEPCENMTLFESLLLTIVILIFFVFGMLSYKIVRRLRRK
jgi:hypothetical protein